MEKIEILLEKLDNTITASLAKRLDALDDLNEKLNLIGEEYEKDPSDDNRIKYNEIIEQFEEEESKIVVDLEALLTKRKADELAKQEPATPPVTPPATPPVTPPVTPPATPPVTPPATPKVESDEKKSSSGVLTLLVGSVLLVASLGAINFFRKQ